MIVNAKEMLKIQKQMEQKEKNRPIHSDYCLECGCPKEICCERRGRVEECSFQLSEWKNLRNSLTNNGMFGKDASIVGYCDRRIAYLEKRIEELKVLGGKP